MRADASLAKLYRDFGDSWEIEQIPPGTKWVAVMREPGGDYLRIVVANAIGTLRFRMNEVEHAISHDRSAHERAAAAQRGPGDRGEMPRLGRSLRCLQPNVLGVPGT